MRVSKLLANDGICSRREAELFIQRGWVRVDGEVVTQLGMQVDNNSEVTIDCKAKQHQKKLLTIVLNKPIGYVSGQPQKGYKPAVSLITRKNQIKSEGRHTSKINWPIRGLAPAGRLDIDSTGLLVLTQDGRVARSLIAPTSNIEKEYLVRVDKPVTTHHAKQLEHGLKLDGVELLQAEIKLLDQRYFQMILTEGRKRQIRRMCLLVGLKVVGLKRVRIGELRLGSLPIGKWRLLSEREVF